VAATTANAATDDRRRCCRTRSRSRDHRIHSAGTRASGSSAGAMNGAVLADGLVRGGQEGARAALAI
jgi:hypothetical protein